MAETVETENKILAVCAVCGRVVYAYPEYTFLDGRYVHVPCHQRVKAPTEAQEGSA